MYKIKKPVNFGFLDFTTLEKRKFFCEKEVQLNKRLCPDLYIGVVPVTKEEVAQDLKRRDYSDTTREYGPLVKAEDAIYLDTTEMSIDEVVENIISAIRS